MLPLVLSLFEAGQSCDLVVEAILENIEVKQKLFAQYWLVGLLDLFESVTPSLLSRSTSFFLSCLLHGKGRPGNEAMKMMLIDLQVLAC